MSASSSEIASNLQQFLGNKYGPQLGWDPVNKPMIRHWCEAMGDANPVYANDELARQSHFDAVIAPPTMIQAWTMKGFGDDVAPGSVDENPFEALVYLEQFGYLGVVAVNCDQEYVGVLKEGDRVSHYCTVSDISEPKTTPLGEGFFITVSYRFYRYSDTDPAPSSTEPDGSQLVATMDFRVLKYKSVQAAPTEESTSGKPKSRKITRPKPAINKDNQFFWQGLEQGKLLIQQCSDCDKLRHPPSPMCPHCQSLQWQVAEASGRGEIYSFVNLHHPQVPPFDSPNPIALVQLEEGTRIVGQLIGIKPKHVKIGQAVTVEISEQDGIPLAQFRVDAAAAQNAVTKNAVTPNAVTQNAATK